MLCSVCRKRDRVTMILPGRSLTGVVRSQEAIYSAAFSRASLPRRFCPAKTLLCTTLIFTSPFTGSKISTAPFYDLNFLPPSGVGCSLVTNVALSSTIQVRMSFEKSSAKLVSVRLA